MSAGRGTLTMKHGIVIFACGLALLAAETSADVSDEAAMKASRGAWAALDKSAKELMRKDFQGGFASYWHSNIDAARAMYESVLTNGVFLNEQKIDALRQVAQMHLEATRDEEAALGAMERAFALPGLSGEEKARAEAANETPEAGGRPWRTFAPAEVAEFVRAVNDVNTIHQGERPVVPGLLILERLLQTPGYEGAAHLTLKFIRPAFSGEALMIAEAEKGKFTIRGEAALVEGTVK